MATVWQDKACKIAHTRWLCLTLWLAPRLIEHMNIPTRSKPGSTTTAWAKHGKSNTTATEKDSRTHEKLILVYKHAAHTLYTQLFCTKALPFHWLTMNLILVKFDLERTGSCKVGESDERVRTEKNLALNHDYWQASIARADRGNTGQSVISSERLWKQSKRGGKWENVTQKGKKKLTRNLFVRIFRLFKERLSYVRAVPVTVHCGKLAWVNFQGYKIFLK